MSAPPTEKPNRRGSLNLRSALKLSRKSCVTGRPGAVMPYGCQGGAEPQRCGYTCGGLVLLPNVGSLGWQVGTGSGGGHQEQQQHRLPAGSGALSHAGSLPGAGLGAFADILAVK